MNKRESSVLQILLYKDKWTKCQDAIMIERFAYSKSGQRRGRRWEKFSEEKGKDGFCYLAVNHIDWMRARGLRAFLRAFSISFAPSVSSDSSYFSSSYHRIARCDRACGGHVISVRNPDEWMPWSVSSTFLSPHEHQAWWLNWRAARGISSSFETPHLLTITNDLSFFGMRIFFSAGEIKSNQAVSVTLFIREWVLEYTTNQVEPNSNTFLVSSYLSMSFFFN